MTRDMICHVLYFLAVLASSLAGDASQYFQNYCETNDDCVHPTLCCSITPAFGKRQVAHHGNVDKNFNVHYCLPYKTENATWCVLRDELQYSPDRKNYFGLCPCRPGLRCTPTTELDPKYYPRDRYGKCTIAVS